MAVSAIKIETIEANPPPTREEVIEELRGKIHVAERTIYELTVDKKGSLCNRWSMHIQSAKQSWELKDPEMQGMVERIAFLLDKDAISLVENATVEELLLHKDPLIRAMGKRLEGLR